jgi:hypothetical protein
VNEPEVDRHRTFQFVYTLSLHVIKFGRYRLLFRVFRKLPLHFNTRITHTHTHMKAVCKVRGLNLLLRVGNLWRCGDGLFSEVPPLASDALLTTLHPVLQTVDHFEISYLGAPFSWLEKPRNRKGRDLDCRVDVLVGLHRSTFSKLNTEFNSDLAFHRHRGKCWSASVVGFIILRKWLVHDLSGIFKCDRVKAGIRSAFTHFSCLYLQELLSPRLTTDPPGTYESHLKDNIYKQVGGV